MIHCAMPFVKIDYTETTITVDGVVYTIQFKA